MRYSTRYAVTLALALQAGACGDAYTVVRGSCQAIVSGEVVTGSPMSTVQVGNPGHCTGSYIAPGVVMTAAHCGNPAYVRVGDVVRSNILYVPHPQFVAGTLTNDIALVFLDGELPIDLAKLGAASYGLALVQGYGLDEYSNTGILREGITEVTEFWAPSTLVTVGPVDSCYGDSGGPLYQGGVQVGIVRSGLPGAPNTAEACGQGGLYSLVASYRDWLNSEVDHLNWVSYCE